MYQTFNLYSPLSPPEDYYESTLDWIGCSPLAKTQILCDLYPPIPVPKVLREEEKILLTGKPKCSNKAFVVKMPCGRVWGEKAVISPDNKLLWDVSVEWARWPKEHSIFQQKNAALNKNQQKGGCSKPSGSLQLLSLDARGTGQDSPSSRKSLSN